MRRLFGGCLVAAGILIAGASGLCSIGLLMNGVMVDPLGAIWPQRHAQPEVSLDTSHAASATTEALPGL